MWGSGATARATRARRRAPTAASAPTAGPTEFKEKLRDAIGGVTEEEYQARLAAASTPVNPALDDR